MNSQAAHDSELDQYDFELPRELIAQEPAAQRSDARMLVVHRDTQQIEHSWVRDLPSHLRAGDVMVVNDSRVIPARLAGFRQATGGKWEGLFLRASDQGVGELLSQTRGRLVDGEVIVLRDGEGREAARLVSLGPAPGGRWWFRPESNEPWSELLQRCGRIPIPPYIRDGQMMESDRERYQTVYARCDGSVAAPTAGLHLTQPLIQSLRAGGVALTAVTLHVGVGTFRPIQVSRLDDHRMHEEWGELTEPVAKRIAASRAEGGRIVAIGTTSTRVLESAALHHDGALAAWQGETDLFIRPGHRFRAVDALLTNFHLPRSSLLVLVSAFAGRDLIQRAYREAIRERYRFYSYGDCMLLL